MTSFTKTLRVYAKIDLNQIKENLDNLKSNIPGDSRVIAVVKANAYGHGAVAVARFVENIDYIYGFAVAAGSEALELIDAGIKKPILILGGVFPEEIPELIENEIHMCLYSEEVAEMISSEAFRLGKKAHVHVKIDTGMGRIGFGHDSLGIAQILKALNGDTLIPEGIFTHFARADEEDKQFTSLQLERFENVVETLKAAGVTFPLHHTSNSAGIIDLKGNRNELVRAGIAMYGVYPSDDVMKELVPLKNAMSLHCRVIHVKEVEPGTCISYGGTFVSFEKMRVATVSIGYGDGYPRNLSNRGEVIIRGQKAKIIGRVCMDQMMVDVSHIPEVKFGDDVILVGSDGGNIITIDDVARASGRFNYELMCDITPRVKRIYDEG